MLYHNKALGSGTEDKDTEQFMPIHDGVGLRYSMQSDDCVCLCVCVFVCVYVCVYVCV